MNQLAAFSMTLAIELPLIALAARRLQPAVSWRRVAAAGVAASSLTHPLAWWLRWRLGPDEAVAGFFAIESAVILIETVVLKIGLGWRWRGAAMLSSVVNTASAGLGGLIYQAFYA